MDVQRSLVLASASPRRGEILSRLGFEFETIPSAVDENEVSWDDPVRAARLLAELKAVDVQRIRPRKTIIGADTIVLHGGVPLGKPADSGEAADMLARLSGQRHEVITGLAIVAPPDVRLVDAARTAVFFRPLSGEEIARYIDTAEPFDKAGAYAIQGHAAAFVERVEGDYPNVVGLPVSLLFAMFRELEARR
ncbi:MAG: septum formation protein Maf [Candidatus Krumholzibacteriota bacterium]|nr:septum formation protein Maf [Candidatus Krumholzibacteriota bacterium]